MAGSNAKIVDNEIVVDSTYSYADEKIWGKDMKNSMAPIMLRDGDNALISGNKITINGDDKNRPGQAVSLRESHGVRIENNQIFGTPATYKAFDEESSVREFGNVIRN